MYYFVSTLVCRLYGVTNEQLLKNAIVPANKLMRINLELKFT